MKKLNYIELRNEWRKFFEENKHLYIESKSLIPNNDPSLLWINSGVATLKKYFSGLENPPAKRLVNIQKAVRTNDIENVGKTSRHHTFFEMMGNFSIGDYFKKEAIEFAYNFLIKQLEIDKNLLYITVYQDDEIAYNRWIELGIEPSHIFKEGKDRNFWDVGNGPCGPCTEIYFDRGEKYDLNHVGIDLLKNDIENDRYVEIWNIVFSEFNNNGNDEYHELQRKNIDTGAGYERFLSVLQEVPTNYDTDLFLPLINELEKFTNKKYEVNAFFSNNQYQLEINRSFKVIVDHIKSAVFMVADGAIPSNKDRGYILRRLIRRAISFAERLNLQDNWLNALIEKIIKIMQVAYPYLIELKQKIISVINNEYVQFNKTLKMGLKLFDESLKKHDITAQTIFDLVQTYGFPKLLVDEMCEEHNIQYDEKTYEELFKNHQLISKGDENNNIKALVQQNKHLLELVSNSEFNYEVNEIKNARVISLFDDDFNPISELAGSGWVVLDKTCLYATSGGQLHDDGYINEFEVDNVIKGPNLQHLHHLDSGYLKLNDLVTIKHDALTRSLLRSNHTGVHIIQAMLKKYVDNSIKQAGAFKSKDKFSFDFNYDKKLLNEQILLIEQKANEIILNNLAIQVMHSDLENAKKMNAIMEFNDVYTKQKELRLIQIGDVSLELCGGTHAHNTSDLEILKITGFYSLGSGTWRIEGFTRYLNYFNYLKSHIEDLYIDNNEYLLNLLNNTKNNEQLTYTIKNFKNQEPIKLIDVLSDTLKQNNLQKSKEDDALEIKNISNEILKSNNNDMHFVVFKKFNPKNIASALRSKLNELKSFIIVINELDHGYGYFLAANKNYISKNNIDFASILKNINKNIDGNFGGKNNYFQGGSTKTFCLSDWVEIEELK